MAKSPEIMRITNEGMAKELIDAGKRLIEMGMALRDVGIPVVVSYDIEMPSGVLGNRQPSREIVPANRKNGNR